MKKRILVAGCFVWGLAFLPGWASEGLPDTYRAWGPFNEEDELNQQNRRIIDSHRDFGMDVSQNPHAYYSNRAAANILLCLEYAQLKELSSNTSKIYDRVRILHGGRLSLDDLDLLFRDFTEETRWLQEEPLIRIGKQREHVLTLKVFVDLQKSLSSCSGELDQESKTTAILKMFGIDPSASRDSEVQRCVSSLDTHLPLFPVSPNVADLHRFRIGYYYLKNRSQSLALARQTPQFLFYRRVLPALDRFEGTIQRPFRFIDQSLERFPAVSVFTLITGIGYMVYSSMADTD